LHSPKLFSFILETSIEQATAELRFSQAGHDDSGPKFGPKKSLFKPVIATTGGYSNDVIGLAFTRF
jgi:hypothetical protein